MTPCRSLFHSTNAAHIISSRPFDRPNRVRWLSGMRIIASFVRYTESCSYQHTAQRTIPKSTPMSASTLHTARYTTQSNPNRSSQCDEPLQVNNLVFFKSLRPSISKMKDQHLVTEKLRCGRNPMKILCRTDDLFDVCCNIFLTFGCH